MDTRFNRKNGRAEVLEAQKETRMTDNVTHLYNKQNWVFTFLYGSALKMYYAELYGTFDETRDEMFRLFGDKWAFQYPSKEEAGVDKFELLRLDLSKESGLDSKLFELKGE